MRAAIRFFIFVVFVCTAFESRAETKWPCIWEFEFSIGVLRKSERVFFSVPLRDEKGKTIYTLFGIGGSESYLDALTDKTGIEYIGPLQLRLVEGTRDSENCLLCEDESAPWFSRGQLHYEELLGACGKYPEYGVLRHFRLRGFELTLHFSDIETGAKGEVSYFNLKISLKNCPTCLSEQAEQPGYISPYKGGMRCEPVVKGNATRMCRDWERGGSWAPCKK